MAATTREDKSVILETKNLRVYFKMDEGLLKAVDGVDYKVHEGRTLGVVGESGCGKSVSVYATMLLLPKYAELMGDILLYKRDGKQLPEPINIAKLAWTGPEIRSIRGGQISMIFQEPMKAFSPIHTIGNQIIEGILLHNTQDEAEAEKIAIDILTKVGMSSPETRLKQYPHELSGGMRQRAMIAMALSCNPMILICDEPTTALDVTVQAQVLDLVNGLKRDIGTAVIFITHDLGVIAEMSDEVAVMYLGKMVEYAEVDTLFHHPLHPYTTALLRSIPKVTVRSADSRLESIEGTVPYPMNLPKGCGFYSRCTRAQDGVCNVEDIPMVELEPGHLVRCVVVQKEMQGGK